MKRIKTVERHRMDAEARLAEARGVIQQTQEQVTLLQEKVCAMEKKLALAGKQKLWELLEQAATHKGELGRKIYNLAQQLELTNQSAQERADWHALLPTDVHDGRAMQYDDRFLSDLQKLQERVREEVVDALNRFAEYGELYPSFKTRRWMASDVAGTPDESFESRSSREFRFFWKQNGSTIHFYRAGHHTEFSASEW